MNSERYEHDRTCTRAHFGWQSCGPDALAKATTRPDASNSLIGLGADDSAREPERAQRVVGPASEPNADTIPAASLHRCDLADLQSVAIGEARLEVRDRLHSGYGTKRCADGDELVASAICPRRHLWCQEGLHARHVGRVVGINEFDNGRDAARRRRIDPAVWVGARRRRHRGRGRERSNGLRRRAACGQERRHDQRQCQ
jgi:hypothetical protein